MGIKSDPTWKPDSQGVIREVMVKEEMKADTSLPCRGGPWLSIRLESRISKLRQVGEVVRNTLGSVCSFAH